MQLQGQQAINKIVSIDAALAAYTVAPSLNSRQHQHSILHESRIGALGKG